MPIITYRTPNSRSLFPSAGFPAWDSGVGRLVASAFSGLDAVGSYAGFVPVTLDEDEANLYVRAELPGVGREAVNVEFADGELTVSAERKQKIAGQEETVSLRRTVALPAEVQADKATAAYENGVLTVTLPKRAEAKPLKISVQ
jgi:HSP20 family protein